MWLALWGQCDMAPAADVAAARRGLHVLVIGRQLSPKDNDQILEDFYDRVRLLNVFTIARCDDPHSLARVVREAVQKQAAPEHNLITTLDLFDHGGPGRMRMGNEMLSLHHFNGGPKAEPSGQSAEDLRDYLAPDARVRLLGCNTACGEEGRQLLLDLHAWLNQNGSTDRLAYGAIYNVRPDRIFDAHGRFNSDEAVYLFSSREAQARVAPSIEERIKEIEERIRKMLEQAPDPPAHTLAKPPPSPEPLAT